MSSQVAAALIGAISGIISAVIGGVFTLLAARSMGIKITTRGDGNASSGTGDATIKK